MTRAIHELLSFATELKQIRRHRVERGKKHCQLGYRLGIEHLEDRVLLAGGSVEIINLSQHSECQEQDSVQHGFVAVEVVGGQKQNIDPIGREVILDSIRPGYSPDGQTFESPVFDNCESGGGVGSDTPKFDVASPDGMFSLKGTEKPSFPAPQMEVIVNGMTFMAHQVDLFAQTPLPTTHFPGVGTIFSNSATRWKFADPDGSVTKYTGSAFFGPLSQDPGDDVPGADITKLTVVWPSGQRPTFIAEYAGGGSAEIKVLESTTERTRIHFTANFHATPGDPFMQYSGMIPSTENTRNSNASEVQVSATYSNTDGFDINHVLDQGSSIVEEVYETRNQRPERDTNTGPDHIFRFDPDMAPIFLGHTVIEGESDGGLSNSRDNASQDKARQIGTANLSVQVNQNGHYLPSLVYSRFNAVSTTLTAQLDGSPIGSFPTVDTSGGVPGVDGWDQFATTKFGSIVLLDAGTTHQLQVAAGATTELDTASFIQVALPIADEIGVRRNHVFLLDENGNGGWEPGSDQVIPFGFASDTPLIGDWNGDGKDEIGVRRNEVFYLDQNGSGIWELGADRAIPFGLASDTPLIGDWNGDGTDEIGVRRGDTFYLDKNGNGSWNPGIDLAVIFGFASDTPLIGDWNGDGIDDIGVRRGATFLLDQNGNSAWDTGVDAVIPFGFTSDTPLIGDWNGDDIDDIGVRRGATFLLDQNGNRAWNTGVDAVIPFGFASDTPLIGNWQSDSPLKAPAKAGTSNASIAPVFGVVLDQKSNAVQAATDGSRSTDGDLLTDVTYQIKHLVGSGVRDESASLDKLVDDVATHRETAEDDVEAVEEFFGSSSELRHAL